MNDPRFEIGDDGEILRPVSDSEVHATSTILKSKHRRVKWIILAAMTSYLLSFGFLLTALSLVRSHFPPMYYCVGPSIDQTADKLESDMSGRILEIFLIWSVGSIVAGAYKFRHLASPEVNNSSGCAELIIILVMLACVGIMYFLGVLSGIRCMMF